MYSCIILQPWIYALVFHIIMHFHACVNECSFGEKINVYFIKIYLGFFFFTFI